MALFHKTTQMTLALCMTATLVEAQGAPDSSLRPQTRSQDAAEQQELAVTSTAELQLWIADFRDRALAKGIAPQVFDRAMAGARYDSDVIRRDRNQAEFTKTIWDYLGTAVSGTRIANGKKALSKHRDTLNKIEVEYGVDQQVIVAIWGLESAYGTFRGSSSVINSLATLAADSRRAAFFENELLLALTILQDGHTQPANMKGSWAGAMGHTQFMPSSFDQLAVDFTGDGRKNIWGDDPTDALASTANYLKHYGWEKGVPWGVEVQLPSDFDYTTARRDNEKLPSDWGALGVVAMDGRSVPDHGPASVLLPAGHLGAAFLIFHNFEVIEHYNTADAYVIGVGHLADRIMGGPVIQHSWPTSDRALTLDERLELQRKLTTAGFDTEKIDGKIGPLTINAVRRYQIHSGLVPDGYASLALLQKLQK